MDLTHQEGLPPFNWCHGQDHRQLLQSAELPQGHQNINKNFTERAGAQMPFLLSLLNVFS